MLPLEAKMPEDTLDRNLYHPVTRGHLTEQVTSQIQELILSGELLPGDKLPSQRDLAASLGVSPVVVREAIKTLEERGLLEARVGSGTYVSELTHESIADTLGLLLRQGKMSFDHLHEVRRTLEIEIAGLAAARAQPDDIVKLEVAIQQMDEGLDRPNLYIEADFEFHLALARSTQNPLFPLLTFTLLDVLQRSRELIFQVPGAPGRGQTYHRAICERVRHGDVEGARAAMQEHLRQVASDGAASQSIQADLETS
jgi:GntR family transcriptional repressor for pyruvate dehydrogenase complex